MKIYCISDRDIESFSCHKPFGVISISSVSQLTAFPRWKVIPYFSDILSLFFDDIPQKKSQVSGDLYFWGINQGQVNLIVQFVNQLRAKGIETIVCQCEAGWSRSAGVAAAIAFVMNGDCMDYVDSEKKSPNVRVYGMLLAALIADSRDKAV